MFRIVKKTSFHFNTLHPIIMKTLIISEKISMQEQDTSKSKMTIW